jgi:hypothetical protein
MNGASAGLSCGSGAVPEIVSLVAGCDLSKDGRSINQAATVGLGGRQHQSENPHGSLRYWGRSGLNILLEVADCDFVGGHRAGYDSNCA